MAIVHHFILPHQFSDLVDFGPVGRTSAHSFGAEAPTTNQITELDALITIEVPAIIKREIIDLLNVQVTLGVENGKKYAYAECYLGENWVPVINTTSLNN